MWTEQLLFSRLDFQVCLLTMVWAVIGYCGFLRCHQNLWIFFTCCFCNGTFCSQVRNASPIISFWRLCRKICRFTKTKLAFPIGFLVYVCLFTGSNWCDDMRLPSASWFEADRRRSPRVLRLSKNEKPEGTCFHGWRPNLFKRLRGVIGCHYPQPKKICSLLWAHSAE